MKTVKKTKENKPTKPIRPNRQVVINDILLELENGISYTNCLKANQKLWGLSTSTFDRYWGLANKKFKEIQDLRSAAIVDKYIELEKKAVELNILNKFERQAILSSIARGEIPLQKPIVCDGVIQQIETVPSWADRRAAIAELNKMDGDYAPIKQDITNRVTQIDFTD